MALLVLCVHVGSAFDEEMEETQLRLPLPLLLLQRIGEERTVERGAAVVIGEVDVEPLLEQERHDLLIVSICSQVER
jgi:hypothetical protein